MKRIRFFCGAGSFMLIGIALLSSPYPEASYHRDAVSLVARRKAPIGVATGFSLFRPAILNSGSLNHGQAVGVGNTGRAGAAVALVPGYSPTPAIVRGDQKLSVTQTIRNKIFTGKVIVAGGHVTFEFCSFTYAPPRASAQLQQYNHGVSTSMVTCNWCDFDPGLRGNQGHFETCNAQFGERGVPNPATIGSAFTLYRCRLQGCGNSIGVHQYQSSGSAIVECLFGTPTRGEGSHPDGIEIYGSDNISIIRSRIELDSRTDQSCINITDTWGPLPSGNPLVIQDCYINGGISPVLTRAQDGGPGSYIKNVRYTGNYFGDSNQWGRECDFNAMDVTYDSAYARLHPAVIYWATTNVWAPDGEGVTNPAHSVAGEIPAAMPHKPGGFIDSQNFYGGEVWIWSGRVVR